MDKIFLEFGRTICVFGGIFLGGTLMALLSQLLCEAWMAASNRFRKVCRGESLIFEYWKNREEFLKWMEAKKHEKENICEAVDGAWG